MQCRHIRIHCHCFNFLYKEETSQESQKLPFTQHKLPLSETNTFLHIWLLCKRPKQKQKTKNTPPPMLALLTNISYLYIHASVLD